MKNRRISENTRRVRQPIDINTFTLQAYAEIFGQINPGTCQTILEFAGIIQTKAIQDNLSKRSYVAEGSKPSFLLTGERQRLHNPKEYQEVKAELIREAWEAGKRENPSVSRGTIERVIDQLEKDIFKETVKSSRGFIAQLRAEQKVERQR